MLLTTKKYLWIFIELIILSSLVFSGYHLFSLFTFESILLFVTSLIGFFYVLSKILQSFPCPWLAQLEENENPTIGIKLWKGWNELCISIFPVLLFVFVLRSFFFEPFRIPSGSMLPSLHLGDFVLVNKMSYGARLPISGYPVIAGGDVERGDIIVFRFPKTPEVDYIKRVVGLPGDTVTIKGEEVYINNHLLKQQALGIYNGKQKEWIGAQAKHFKETNQEKEYSVVWFNYPMPYREVSYRIPLGHYFVMGDNRNNSNDSRFWGFVPENNIKGRALIVWLNWHDEIDWSRIGTKL